MIWSLCNEGMCDRGIAKGPNNAPGWDYSGRKSKAIFQQWDPSMQRPVSANPHDFGNWSTNDTILDLIGLDYPCAHGPCYDRTHLIAPTIPIIGSEMGSTTSDRGVYALSWSADNKRFITASADMTVKMWDAEARALVATFKFEDALENQQLGCLWMGEHIMSVALNGHIYFHDESNPGVPKRVIKGHTQSITAVAAEVGSGVAFTASTDGKVCRYNLSTGAATELASSFPSSVLSMQAVEGVVAASCINDTIAITQATADAVAATSPVPSTPNGVAYAQGTTLVACLNEVSERVCVGGRVR